jgi:hypothetical protein
MGLGTTRNECKPLDIDYLMLVYRALHQSKIKFRL